MLEGANMKERCPWPGNDPLYIAYHDNEWGVPEYDSKMLWEKLTLEGFQAGLSWITILRKREAFRTAFDNFQPEIIANYNDKKINSLVKNKEIVRHRGKIEATINNAKIYLDIEKRKGFNNFLWEYTQFKPLQTNTINRADVQTQSPLSQKISKDLKKLGYRYCGPTIIYAFIEAVGIINNHFTSCHRYTEVQDKQSYNQSGTRSRPIIS